MPILSVALTSFEPSTIYPSLSHHRLNVHTSSSAAIPQACPNMLLPALPRIQKAQTTQFVHLGPKDFAPPWRPETLPSPTLMHAHLPLCRTNTTPIDTKLNKAILESLRRELTKAHGTTARCRPGSKFFPSHRFQRTLGLRCGEMTFRNCQADT